MPHPPTSGLPNPASYDLSQDGVVLDNVTGLMWQRQGSSPDDSFLEISDEAEIDSSRAEAYCSDLSLGGFDDWRLPSRIELISLVDFDRIEPASDPDAFPDAWGEGISADFISVSVGPKAGQLWCTDFASGETRGLGQRVRCVRVENPTEVPTPRYVIQGESPDETVADQVTGLVWQRTPSDESYTFDEAQAYCAGLSLSGGAFRAPSMKELHTIVDETKLDAPAIDLEIFEMPLGGGLFWTSSKNAESPDENAWYVGFGEGEGRSESSPRPTNLGNEYYVRCVK